MPVGTALSGKGTGLILVDEIDLPILAAHEWHVIAGKRSGKQYAARQDGRKTTYLHRQILKAGTGQEVDHINGNGLDNRRSNLRLATHAENLRNMRRHVDNRSGFKGVSWNRRRAKWLAQITTAGRYQYLGYFDKAEDAAHAYDTAARECHGDFAWVNFPLEAA